MSTLAIILGLVFAAVLAFTITISSVASSNDMGNHKGDFHTFATHSIRMINQKMEHAGWF